MRLCIPETCGGGGRAGESPTTLRYLIRNKWLAAEQEEGTFMIRLGKRAKKLREGTPRREAGHQLGVQLLAVRSRDLPEASTSAYTRLSPTRSAPRSRP